MLFGCQNVGSPSKEIPDVQTGQEEIITDKAPFTDVPPDVVPDVSEVVFLQRSAMSNGNQLSTSAAIETNDIIGEVGKVFVRQGNPNRWHKISFLNEFRNPVVIMQPLSYNSGDPAVIRIRNVTSQGFEFQIDEWDYLDGAHGKEIVTYLVMESGLWTNGLVYEVGKVKTNHRFKKVTLNPSVNYTAQGAVILTQVQSRNDPAAVTTRQQVATGGFRVKVQEEEGADGTHPLEDIGYIAILPGEGPFGKFQALSAKTGNIVSHNFRTLRYGFTADVFGDSYFLAGMQTYAGEDTASLRYRGLTDGSVQVRVEEEQSADRETNHPNESVGYLILRQVVFDESKITAFDGADYDYFGGSVAIDRDTMVVGAYKNDDKGADAGAAYIYERNAKGKWVLVKKIQNPDEEDRLFGHSVAISGNTVVIGVYLGGDGSSYPGLAYIFERNQGGNDRWGQVKKLLASDRASNDSFGRSVAISGDTVVVGAAYKDDDKGLNSGAAYVFERNKDGIDNWGEAKKLLASDGAAGDEFGRSVAISGDTVVVGAWETDDKGTDSGSAYIFERNQGDRNRWGQVKKLLVSDGVAGDNFGNSVAVSGNTIVVGAYRDDDSGSGSGSVYIFERNQSGSNKWGQVIKLLASDGAAGDEFGDSVAVSGNTVVVGADRDDDNGTNSGSIYIFKPNNGGNKWEQAKKIVASDGATADYFGHPVAISGSTVVVGAGGDDDNGASSGSTYIFE